MADADIIPIGSGGQPRRGNQRRTARPVAGPAAAHRDATADEQAGAGPAVGQASPVDPAQFAGFEHLVRDTLGPEGERKVAELLAILRRRLTGDYEIDEFGYDVELTDEVILSVLRPLAQKWFRVEVRGAEFIPDTGGALIVANHSGTLPLDGLITQLMVKDHAGRPLRTLAADLVFQTPFVGELARKSGATLASNDDAERLLGRGELVGVWPEGFKGIGKPFGERYKLQRFGRGGFVSAAMRTGVPIVPCSIVGAEEIYPLVGNIASLARLLGVPYLPITPFFPLLGPLGLIPLPSKWLIEFGEPIRTDEFPEGAADDPMLVFNVTDQVRETIQQTLYSLLMQRRSVFF
jgi:1-acyl-sn-glycerol-3-phosphate acyltransferase